MIGWIYNNSIINNDLDLCLAMSFFDTDSSFWVCNISATGHTCNGKSLFLGELISSIYIVDAATGTSEITLMGTVVLWLTDNNGDKHTFTLTHVNYMPKSPVNLLSMRVLSEQFTNEHGFDQQVTGISSIFDDHTLYWDHSHFSKTFKTHSSGLPECLFSSGYSQLQSFTTFLMPYYNDMANWKIFLNWMMAKLSFQKMAVLLFIFVMTKFLLMFLWHLQILCLASKVCVYATMMVKEHKT